MFIMAVTRNNSKPISTSEERCIASVASANSFAITLAIVLERPKILSGIIFEFPMSMVTAIVSPNARPKASRTPALIPDHAKGMIMLFIVAVVNLVTILWKIESISWMGLYFKRKRLEEQQKIDALKSEQKE